MMVFMLIAGPCFAEEPLETLNTVEDTVISMEVALHAHAAEQDERRDAERVSGTDATGQASQHQSRFVSDEPRGNQKHASW